MDKKRTDTGITEASLELFLAYARDAGNWGGTPLVGGNVDTSAALRGNLTQLKRAGLIETWIAEKKTWMKFTAAGKAFAAGHGVEIED